MQDNKYLHLPNSDFAILTHPNGTDNSIEVGLFQDHKFAFYFWYKWWKNTSRKLNKENAPALITIDWHQDLCEPSEKEKKDLETLNLDSYKEVALFTWDSLNHLNDGHILSAAYLNLIGDIFVLCKQDGSEKEYFSDLWGNEHKIICFDKKENLEESLKKQDITEVYFDIDLDYFTESNDPSGGGEDLILMEEKDIRSLLDINSNLIEWVLKRTEGMTIATEPKWCGGVRNSNMIYNIVDDALFDNYLFSPHTKWKHLNNSN
jgi:hypothetical protein